MWVTLGRLFDRVRRGHAGHMWFLASGILYSLELFDAKINLDILLTELS